MDTVGNSRLDHRSVAIRTTSSGITLIEALITLAVLVIITAIAAPNFSDLLSSSKGKGTAKDLQADLDFARSEAIRLATTEVSVCPANNDFSGCAISTNWSSGWIIWNGTSAVKINNSTPSSLKLDGPESVTFDSIGRSKSKGTVTEFSVYASGSSSQSGFRVCRSAGGTSDSYSSGSWSCIAYNPNGCAASNRKLC